MVAKAGRTAVGGRHNGRAGGGGARRAAARTVGARGRAGAGFGSEILGRLRENAQDVADRLKEGAREIKDEAATQVRELGRVVRDEADRVVAAPKRRLAARIHSVAWAAQKAAGLLQVGKLEGVAKYVDLAAAAAQDVSKYLERSSTREMTRELSGLVRRHAAVALIGAVLTGLALGRLLKAAAPVPAGTPGGRVRAAGRKRKKLRARRRA